MPRTGSSPFAFPAFSGATRRLVLWNLFAYFALLLLHAASANNADLLAGELSFIPGTFLHGWFWQPFTYSLVHIGIFGTLFELLSLWFLAGFLESAHSSSWITGLYVASVLGTAAAATALYVVGRTLWPALDEVPLYGCFGGIFGLLVAIGVLYGDVQFMLFPLPIGIKARYLAAIYALVTIAMLFGQQRIVRLFPVGRSAGRAACLFAWLQGGDSPSPSASIGMDCAIATTAGSADAPPANSRSICARRGAPFASTARAGRSMTIPTTRSAGTRTGSSWIGLCRRVGRLKSLLNAKENCFSLSGARFAVRGHGTRAWSPLSHCRTDLRRG